MPKIRMSKKNSKPKNKKKYIRKIDNSYILLYTLSITILILFFIIFFYVVVLFPKNLSHKILSEVINIYSPLIVEDKEEIKILKLSEKPDTLLNQEIYNTIYNKYGIETIFEKISIQEDKGINKIMFSKNSKIYEDFPIIYIYWDNKILEQEDYEEKEFTVSTILNKKREITIIKENKNLPLPKNEKIKESNEIKDFKSNYNKKEEGSFILKESKINLVKKEKPKNLNKIAIVIDDVGYYYKTSYEFFNLGIPLTFAIIPDMPLSKKIYWLLQKSGYACMLHIPMEPEKGKNFVEKNAILTEMDDNTIRERIKLFLNEYPSVIGANNHMGSKVIKDARAMKIILGELANNNKLWLDSMTSLNSVSKEIAGIYNLPFYKRDVFLDNKKDINSIRESFDLLIKEAKKKGFAIGIGHIQSENLAEVIKEYYNKKDQLGIEFVFLNEIFSLQ